MHRKKDQWEASYVLNQTRRSRSQTRGGSYRRRSGTHSYAIYRLFPPTSHSFVVMQLVDKVSNLEETMLQLKENNAELIKLVKAQCNANDTIRDKNCALVEEIACLRNEINRGNEIRAMNDKLVKLSSDLANLSQATTERESYAAVTSRKTSKRIFMFDDHILWDIHKVTSADNEPVDLHTTSRITPKDLRRGPHDAATDWQKAAETGPQRARQPSC